jgi:hypothetical protein
MDLGRMADASSSEDIRLNDIEVAQKISEYGQARGIVHFKTTVPASSGLTLDQRVAKSSPASDRVDLPGRPAVTDGRYHPPRRVDRQEHPAARPSRLEKSLCSGRPRGLADDFNKRVIVVDTSNEIAGDAMYCIRGSERPPHAGTCPSSTPVMIEAVKTIPE